MTNNFSSENHILHVEVVKYDTNGLGRKEIDTFKKGDLKNGKEG